MGEIAEPEKGDTLCAISPALPILRVYSPTMSLASGFLLTLSTTTMILPISRYRRQFLGVRQEAVCEGGGDVVPARAFRRREMAVAGRRPRSDGFCRREESSD